MSCVQIVVWLKLYLHSYIAVIELLVCPKIWFVFIWSIYPILYIRSVYHPQPMYRQKWSTNPLFLTGQSLGMRTWLMCTITTIKLFIHRFSCQIWDVFWFATAITICTDKRQRRMKICILNAVQFIKRIQLIHQSQRAVKATNEAAWKASL